MTDLQKWYMWAFDAYDQPRGLILLGEFQNFDDAWKATTEDPRDIIVMGLMSDQQHREIHTRAEATPTKGFRIYIHMTLHTHEDGGVQLARPTGHVEVFLLEDLPEAPETPVMWYNFSAMKLKRSLEIIDIPFPKHHLH